MFSDVNHHFVGGFGLACFYSLVKNSPSVKKLLPQTEELEFTGLTERETRAGFAFQCQAAPRPNEHISFLLFFFLFFFFLFFSFLLHPGESQSHDPAFASLAVVHAIGIEYSS